MNTDLPLAAANLTPAAADTAALIAQRRTELQALEAKLAAEQKAKLTGLPAQLQPPTLVLVQRK